MELLKRRILQDGRCFPGGILKVDSFYNHQMDPILMKSIAVEFVRRFAGQDFNKVMTIEASGIAPAIMVGYLLELPVVFAKKKQPKTMENMLSTTVHSFTKDREYSVCISHNFLNPGDRILFIDDFLANGNAAQGCMGFNRSGRGRIGGDGIYYRKIFSTGGKKIEGKGCKGRVAGHY